MSDPSNAFTLVCASGVPGIDDDTQNPLARATRRLLEDGQRFVSAIPAVITDGSSGAAYWVGFFVLTVGGRILFFPGASQRAERTVGGLWDGRGRFDRDLEADHLTLEADRQTWHLTDRKGRQRQGGGRTSDVGAGRRLWFCMTASDVSDLRVLRTSTITRFEPVANARAAQDRIEAYVAGVTNGAASPIPLPVRPASEAVLHVAIVVAPPGSSPYSGDGMPLPVGVPGVERVSPPAGTTANYVALLLSPSVQIQVLVAWLPGKASPGMLTFTYAWP